jgi:hypothetical protein
MAIAPNLTFVYEFAVWEARFRTEIGSHTDVHTARLRFNTPMFRGSSEQSTVGQIRRIGGAETAIRVAWGVADPAPFRWVDSAPFF